MIRRTRLVPIALALFCLSTPALAQDASPSEEASEQATETQSPGTTASPTATETQTETGSPSPGETATEPEPGPTATEDPSPTASPLPSPSPEPTTDPDAQPTEEGPGTGGEGCPGSGGGVSDGDMVFQQAAPADCPEEGGGFVIRETPEDDSTGQEEDPLTSAAAIEPDPGMAQADTTVAAPAPARVDTGGGWLARGNRDDGASAGWLLVPAVAAGAALAVRARARRRVT